MCGLKAAKRAVARQYWGRLHTSNVVKYRMQRNGRNRRAGQARASFPSAPEWPLLRPATPIGDQSDASSLHLGPLYVPPLAISLYALWGAEYGGRSIPTCPSVTHRGTPEGPVIADRRNHLLTAHDPLPPVAPGRS